MNNLTLDRRKSLGILLGVASTFGAVSANAAEPSSEKSAVSALPTVVMKSVPLESSRTLGNGVVLVTRLDRTAPRVAFSLLIKAGAADETPATAGWRRILTNAMLRASSFKYPMKAGVDPRVDPAANVVTGSQLQRMAEAVGGQLGASVGDDVIEFWATGESGHADVLLNLLLTLVQRPRLSDVDVADSRQRVNLETAYEASDIAVSATASLRTQIYRDAAGKPIAYGLPRSTPESLTSLNPDKIRSFFAKYFVPSRFVLGAAGDIEENAIAAEAQTLVPSTAFAESAMRSPIQAPGTIPAFKPAAKSDPPLIVRQLPTQDAWVFISFLAPKSNVADAAALTVLTAALSDTQVARLPLRLMRTTPVMGAAPRGETALQTSATLTGRRFGSEFVLYAQTGATNVDEVKNAMLDELRKLREAPLSADELLKAKNFVRGSYAVEREALRQRAFDAALASAINAPQDTKWPGRVEMVTAADVRRVANAFTSTYAVGLIMPQDSGSRR